MNTDNISNSIREALQQCEAGNDQPARELFDALLGQSLADPGCAALFGELCFNLGEYETALRILGPVIQAMPANHRALWLAGSSHLKLREIPPAAVLLQQAVKLLPDDSTYLNDYAAVFILERRYSDALPHLERAHTLDPDNTNVLANLANCLSELNRYEEALTIAQRYQQRVPDNPFMHYVIARCHDDLGHAELALEHYRTCIALDPCFGMAYQGVAGASKFNTSDTSFAEQAEAALKLSMSANNRSLIHFALGKVYDDIRNWEKAFFNYHRGNVLKKSLVHTLPRPAYDLFEAIKASFPAELFQQLATGSPSELPIFIVGMPRSGSTLLEQIISSHPRVIGAGELEAIPQVFATLCPTQDYGQLHTNLDATIHDNKLISLANAYLEKLPARASGITRVIDKQLFNFLYLGLIRLMFPQARIFHCIRDPIDTCLSCYFQNFKYIDWSCDFNWIAQHYQFYRDVMHYWQTTLPAGSIIDVHYEKLVADPEPNIREIIQHTGLEWDSACLAFHTSAKSINTASLWQARQPIYKSSIQRWKHYTPHIQDLVRQLEPAAEAKPAAAKSPETQGFWERLKSHFRT